MITRILLTAATIFGVGVIISLPPSRERTFWNWFGLSCFVGLISCMLVVLVYLIWTTP